MNVPDDLLYTESHEWIKREGDKVRVGITDHAQAELTDVVFVELPKIDRQANANKALEADPGLINREPFGQGWLFVMKPDNPDDLKNLKDAAAYKKQIGS